MNIWCCIFFRQIEINIQIPPKTVNHDLELGRPWLKELENSMQCINVSKGQIQGQILNTFMGKEKPCWFQKGLKIEQAQSFHQEMIWF